MTATHTTATADGAMSSTDKPFVAGTYALSREFCHYLIGAGVVAAAGLVGAIWLHALTYVAICLAVLVAGFGGAAATYMYVGRYYDAFRITEYHTRVAAQRLARKAEVARTAIEVAVGKEREAGRLAVEAEEKQRAARAPREIAIKVAGQNDGDGFLYILQFSSGAIKVGQTIHPKQRLAKHRRDAQAYNVILVDGWFSPPHSNHIHNEAVLIGMCRRYGKQAKNEYFHDMDFGQAVRLASQLTFTAGPTRPTSTGVDQ